MLLSIVVPTRNRPDDLLRVLTAIGRRAGLEILVVDDCSGPEESKENAMVCARHPWVRYERFSHRGGAPRARNAGARRATGTFIWFFDDDDFLPPETLSEVMARLPSTNAEVMLLSSTIFSAGQRIGGYRPTESRDTFEEYRRRGQLVSLPCVIMSRAMFERVGGWDESLVAGQDSDLLLRLSHLTALTCWPDLQIRINANPGARLTNSVVRQERAKVQFLRKHWRLLHWQRRLYYVGSFILVVPLWKRFSGRAAAREILKRERGPNE